MREIKFRAWDTRTGKWTDIFYITSDGLYVSLFDGEEIPIKAGILILVEYTGLKDKNGVGIYEGDIVQTDEAGWKAQVIYYRDCFLCTGLDKRGFSVQCNWENFEVIGNIYENPEKGERC